MKKEISLRTKLSHKKTFSRKFVSNRNEKKTKVKMNKPIYLGMSILDISKTLMYKFWYDYFKPKYGDKAKLCYTDTDSFIIHIITEDFLKIFLIMLKNGMIHVVMMKMMKDLFQQVKIKK